MEYQRGILLATVTQNMRNGLRASVEAGRNSYRDVLMALSLMQAGVAGGTEMNFNNSVAWFDFRASWQGAHVNSDGTLAPDAFNGVEQSMVTRNAAGRYTLDLNVDSHMDGLLFAIGNNIGLRNLGRLSHSRLLLRQSPSPTLPDILRQLMDAKSALLPDLNWDLLSRIAMQLLSGNEAELLSGNQPEVLSGNEVKLASENEIEILSGNQFSIFFQYRNLHQDF